MAKQRIAALDFGSSSIHFIEAEINKKGEPTILQAGYLPIESAIIENGKIVDENRLIEEVGRLWRANKIKAKEIWFSVGGVNLQLRTVDKMQWAPDEDFRSMLPYNLRDRLPFELDDFYLDSHTIEQYRSEVDLMAYKKVIVIAVSRNHVDLLTDVLEKNKLRVRLIDAIPLGLVRAFIFNEKVVPNHVNLLVDWGADVSTIVIQKNGQLIHHHTAIDMGGNNVTDRIKKTLKVTAIEAELLKKVSGMPRSETDNMEQTVVLQDGRAKKVVFKTYTDDQLREVEIIISEEISKMLRHINDILDDFFANSRETTLHGVYLSGGSAKLNTLLQRISAEFNGIPCEMAQPFGDSKPKSLSQDVFNNQVEFNNVLGLLVGRE